MNLLCRLGWHRPVVEVLEPVSRMRVYCERCLLRIADAGPHSCSEPEPDCPQLTYGVNEALYRAWDADVVRGSHDRP